MEKNIVAQNCNGVPKASESCWGYDTLRGLFHRILFMDLSLNSFKSIGIFIAPGYTERIGFPIDLSLIRKFIVSRLIKSFSSLHQRIGLICHNCVKFNGRWVNPSFLSPFPLLRMFHLSNVSDLVNLILWPQWKWLRNTYTGVWRSCRWQNPGGCASCNRGCRRTFVCYCCHRRASDSKCVENYGISPTVSRTSAALSAWDR